MEKRLVTVKTAFAQNSNTNKQQFTNSNSTCTADKTSERFQRRSHSKGDPSRSTRSKSINTHTTKRFFEPRRRSKTIVSSERFRVFIPFLTGCDVT
ncbi:hypothetical protein AVEN_244238-1 [Araneus ventricosus]|uniref:Uncharacterized protein n=1 Tax=Araneus ventricosus TaxID=182803 RepID=A0A4Y2KQH1_ARAVE|nr:hypothetical protein AVEN_244238-1 [Araneus ventricosus]